MKSITFFPVNVPFLRAPRHSSWPHGRAASGGRGFGCRTRDFLCQTLELDHCFWRSNRDTKDDKLQKFGYGLSIHKFGCVFWFQIWGFQTTEKVWKHRFFHQHTRHGIDVFRSSTSVKTNWEYHSKLRDSANNNAEFHHQHGRLSNKNWGSTY